MSMCCLDCHDFMDGYNQGKKEGTIEELEKIREEIENDQEQMANEKDFGKYYGMGWAIRIIDKHISELKGEQE